MMKFTNLVFIEPLSLNQIIMSKVRKLVARRIAAVIAGTIASPTILFRNRCFHCKFHLVINIRDRNL